jgi:hypothetical protein
MDHCQNASDPEQMDGLIEAPEPAEPDGEGIAGGATTGETDRDEAVQSLDAWADDLRQAHLADALAALDDRTDLDAADRAAIAACSRAIVDEILRCPRAHLRRMDGDRTDASLTLFDLAERSRSTDLSED